MACIICFDLCEIMRFLNPLRNRWEVSKIQLETSLIVRNLSHFGGWGSFSDTMRMCCLIYSYILDLTDFDCGSELTCKYQLIQTTMKIIKV